MIRVRDYSALWQNHENKKFSLILRKYADSVNEKLNKELLGLNIFTKYLNDEIKNQTAASNCTDTDTAEFKQSFEITSDLLKEAFDRSLLYIIYLNQTNEQFNSINFFIINKWRINKSNSNKNFCIKGI